MSKETHTLIWLFPVAFMLHDFEEILFLEVWLNKHCDEIKHRLPTLLDRQVDALAGTSTAQLSLSVSLIFGLTAISSFWATEYQRYSYFLFASALFFVNGFMHLAQTLFLRRYVPGLITSALIVIPYGLVLYSNLTRVGITNLRGLMIYFLLGAIAMLPFILVMHKIGQYLYPKAVELLIR